MTRFIVRRLLGMIVVMLIISIITFLLLAAIPNGNPAYRLAGRTATAAEIHEIMMMGKELGQIRPGYLADILLVDGNPLKDIKCSLIACRDGPLVDQADLLRFVEKGLRPRIGAAVQCLSVA